MLKYWIAFALITGTSSAATVLRIACGGPGGLDAQGNVWTADAYSSGGAKWTAANQPAMASLPVPYQTLRYSSPFGAPVSYAVPVAPGSYTVTLHFLEPNKTAAGQRKFGVTLNGALVMDNLDLFAAAAGALRPYIASFPVHVSSGQIVVALTPSLGNAVLSAIQVDRVDAAPSGAVYPCEAGWVGDQGLDGATAIAPGRYAMFVCENVSGTLVRMLRARCRSTVAGPTLDVLAPDSGGAYHSILAGTVACAPGGGNATTLPDASYPDGGVLQFVFLIPAGPTIKSIIGVVALTGP